MTARLHHILPLLLLAASPTIPTHDTPGTPPDLTAPRQQAEVLHSAMHSALRVVHDRYYREDEALMIPAASLEEVFRDVEKEHHVQFHWLVVEGQAMNVDHTAKTDFEKAAVQALKSGEDFLETTEADMYRRAAPITLSNHCLKCHMPDRKSTRDRIAGLIISVPLPPGSSH